MRNYVIINGVNSLTIKGLAIKTLPPITKPIQRTLREEIDGRDGDIVTTLGYGAYDRTIEIGLFGDFDIDEVVAYFNQEGTIIFSDEDDKVYNFKALEQVDYTSLLKFRTANVVLHCQPFKYPVTETPLVEEYEYVEATGSNVTLDNTSEAIFNKIDLLGNTEQTQYTGINKFNKDGNLSTLQAAGNQSQITKTNEKITFVTTGQNAAGFYITSNIWHNYVDNFDSTKTYTISADVTLSASAQLKFGVESNATFKTYSGKQRITNTTNASSINAAIVVYLYNNTIGTQVEVENIQIEEGTTAHNFEPYVGGIPSPNPNYPQDIHVVSGDNEIKITGRNLCAGETEGYYINQAGTNAGRTTNDSGVVIETNGGYYTISTTEVQTRYRVGLGNTLPALNSTAGITSSSLKDGTSDTIVKNTAGYKYLFVNATDLTKIQIETGQTKHDFEEYQSQSLPLNLGVQNLINETEATLGTISQSDGTTIGSSTSVYYIPSYIDVKPNEAYSFKYNGTSNITIRAFYYNASKTYLSTAVVSGSNSNQVTFTIPTNAYYLRVQYGSGYYNQGLQLSKGSTPQTISDNPIEMVSMPLMNYKDVFIKEEDKWYKRTQIGKFTIGQWASLIGNATYYQTNFNSTNGIMSFRLSKSQFENFNLPQSANIYKGFSDNFTGAGSNLWNNTNQLYKFGYVDGLIFGILYTDIGLDTWTTSARSFETELTNYLGDVTFYLPLKEETDIEITNETLIDQLEVIKNAISYKGQTNISQTNNDMPFILDLSALKENSDHLVIDNIGNIYSKPTLDLEGTGIVDIYLNDTQMFEVDLSEKNEIVIDTEKMEAYNPTDNTLANRQVTGDYSKFKLDSGENDLRFSGDLTKATITNYERWL